MNVVRNENKRSGSLFSRQDADNFNSFIDKSGLINLPLGGRLFTWMNKAGTKLSKLDRFLISEEVAKALLDVRVTAIDHLWSDHNPILLHYQSPTLVLFLSSFSIPGSLPHGSKSSFFILIPKVSNPIFIKDFHPISLIGVHYKIVAKILANWLDKVINKIVSHKQSAFIVGRQILDGPLILILALNGVLGLELVYPHLRLRFSSMGFHNALSTTVSSDGDVSSMASNSGCASGSFPFTYLGLPFGSNMSLTSSWQIQAMFFWEGSHEARKLAWTKWKNVISSYDNGGLYIGSLKAFNLALIQKWHWRLLLHKNALWVEVIKALHGHKGGFDNNGCIYNALTLRSLNLYSGIFCLLAHCLEILLLISLNIDLLLDLLAILSLMFFEEVLGFAAALAIIVTEVSQSGQHESRKSPTAKLFDVDSRRISIFTVNTKEYHSDVLANITRIMRSTLVQVMFLMINDNYVLEFVS
ncbi:RNA-directed DNA polymerase, eukaryota, reverse transcriptase zinc-binding domain protein [Tanacetum coccineum]